MKFFHRDFFICKCSILFPPIQLIKNLWDVFNLFYNLLAYQADIYYSHPANDVVSKWFWIRLEPLRLRLMSEKPISGNISKRLIAYFGRRLFLIGAAEADYKSCLIYRYLLAERARRHETYKLAPLRAVLSGLVRWKNKHKHRKLMSIFCTRLTRQVITLRGPG